MSKTPQEWLDKINEERKNGNVCFMTTEGLASDSLENIVQQPAEGILYDLNRLPEVVSGWIEGDIKWVNDYAVGDVITYLKKQNDALRKQLSDAIEVLKSTRQHSDAESAEELWLKYRHDAEAILNKLGIPDEGN